jgi:hypothetical protein
MVALLLVAVVVANSLYHIGAELSFFPYLWVITTNASVVASHQVK